MEEEVTGYGRLFTILTKVFDGIKFLEHSLVKSAAAILVGGLATYGVFYDSLGFRKAAAVCGLALPLAHVVLMLLRRPLTRGVLRLRKIHKRREAGHYR